VPDAVQSSRLGDAARAARSAEAAGDEASANEAWRRYRRIRDAARDPDQLLAEGLALSEQARALAGVARRET
jgi:hypothetical protein